VPSPRRTAAGARASAERSEATRTLGDPSVHAAGALSDPV
jgi:hypothetical protein